MDNKFRKLFQWNENRLEDVRFWCEPALTAEALDAIPGLGFPRFDGIATFEARGFYLAGIVSARLNLPVLFLRKHKRFYDKMDHAKISFQNWKGEEEALTVLKKSAPPVSKVLIVDDILDTGRSLLAGQELLRAMNVEIIGAFYLLNAATEETVKQFSFPIRSTAKQKLL